MKIGILFPLYIVLLHLGLSALMLFTLSENLVVFVICELALIVSLLAGYMLFRKFYAPLGFLQSAKDLLDQEPTGTQLVKQGVAEFDQLIAIYNRMLRDIHSEQLKLGEQRGVYEELIKSSPVGLIILDYDGAIQTVNALAEDWLGLGSDDLGRSLSDSPIPVLKSMDNLGPNQSKVFVYKGFKRFSVRSCTFVDRGFERRFFLVEDRTKELQQTERAAYEKLLRTMAHEINNSVGATNSLLGTVRSFHEDLKSEDQEPFCEALDVVVHRNAHLARFIRDLAQVVKLPQPRLKEEPLGTLVGRVVVLMRSVAEENEVTIQSAYQQWQEKVQCDPEQMEQALLNIVKNGIEACDPGGVVKIERTLDPLKLLVWDSGNKLGEAQENLFQPFFTTKQTGQGIGLVLIREILLAHGLEFELESVEGQTRFSIQFD